MCSKRWIATSARCYAGLASGMPRRPRGRGAATGVLSRLLGGMLKWCGCSLVSSNMQKQIVRERVAMGLLHHPSICKLYATFSSELSMYMLLEACLGGELYSYMREVNTLEEVCARRRDAA